MKKHLLLPLLLLAGVAHAQNNAIKLDIFQPLISTLAISYEHKLSESSSFQLGISGTFGYKDDYSTLNFNTYSDSRSTSGFAITPEYRLYLSEKHPALEGFYVAPYARFQYLNQSAYYSTYTSSGSTYTQKYDASLTAFGLGVIVGRHWIFKRRFSLDIYAGPGYTLTSTSSDQPGVSPRKGDFVGYFNDNNYDLRGGVTFGIAF
jgi:outer membrane autotransporter protein